MQRQILITCQSLFKLAFLDAHTWLRFEVEAAYPQGIGIFRDLFMTMFVNLLVCRI